MPMSPRLLRPRGSFSPRNISGLVAWYDAADASSLAQNSNGTTAAGAGDPVGFWRDKAGANHLTQTTNNNRPVITGAGQGGRNVVAFDGSDDFLVNAGMSLTNVTELSLLAVIKYRNPTGTQQVSVSFGGLAPPIFVGAWFAGAALEINRTGTTVGAVVGSWSAGSQQAVASASAASSSAFVQGLIYQSQSASLRVNGTQVGTGTYANQLNSNSGFRLGNYVTNIVPAACDICEVAYYSRALTATEISRLQSHWAAKWGL